MHALAQAAHQAAEKALAALTAQNSKAAADIRRAPTWITKHNWIEIIAEMSRRCIGPDGRVSIPDTDAALAATMDEWCDVTFGLAPSDSELRDAAKTVRAAFRKGPEPPPKKRR